MARCSEQGDVWLDKLSDCRRVYANWCMVFMSVCKDFCDSSVGTCSNEIAGRTFRGSNPLRWRTFSCVPRAPKAVLGPTSILLSDRCSFFSGGCKLVTVPKFICSLAGLFAFDLCCNHSVILCLILCALWNVLLYQ